MSLLRACVSVSLLLSTACAARSVPDVVMPVPFDGQQACYRCLEETLGRSPQADDSLHVDLLVLLSVRARELGLEDQWIDRLDTVVAEQQDRAALTALVGLLRDWPADVTGWAADDRLPHVRRQQELRKRGSDGERVIAGAGLSASLTLYLLQAYRCRVMRIDPAPAELEAWSHDPLLAYGAAACPRGSTEAVRARLEAVVAADPRWVEADVALARMDVAERRMTHEAERRLSRANAAFPESAAIALALATLRQARAELKPALDAYAAVLERVPDHREALLGRTVCLTHLTRHEEAIAAATRLIELGTYHVGEAYYWRSWNRFHAGLLDNAWADSEQALRSLYGTDAFTLSGVVALGRGDLETARDRLEKAVVLDGANCHARTQLGVSLAGQTQWEPAAAALEAAMACHRQHAIARGRELEDLRASPDTSAPHLQSVGHAISEAREAEAEASLQAAGAFAQALQPDRALAVLGPAREHPATRSQAEALARRLVQPEGPARGMSRQDRE